MTSKKENSRGQKFQQRQPGEKRTRSTGPEKPSTERRNSYSNNNSSDRKPFRTGGRTPGFEGSDTSRGDKPFRGPVRNSRFGDSPSSDRPRTSGGPRFNDRPNDRGGDRPFRGPANNNRFNDRPSSDRPRTSGGPRFNDRPSDRGGDKPFRGPVRNNRFNDSQSSDRPRTSGGPRFNDRPNDRGGDKPFRGPVRNNRFNDSQSSDRPRTSGGPRFNDRPNDRGGDKPFRGPVRNNRFNDSQSSDRPRTSGGPRFNDRPNDRGGDRPFRGPASNNRFNDRPSSDRPRNTESRFNDRPNDRGGDKPFRGPAKTSRFGDSTDKRTGTRTPKPKLSDHVKSTRAGAEKNYKGNYRTRENTGRDLEKAVLLSGEDVRLNRYIANSGICSRREADVLIEQGLVLMNGQVVTELGQKVKPGDEVKVDGRRITPEKPVYILLNKPKGYITSTFDPEGRATVMDLIDLPGKERIYPIGRLDRNTTGVMLLTNDGELAQKLMHPSFEIKKVYRATLDRRPSKEHMLAWVSGIELEDGFMAFEQCGFVEKEEDCVVGVEIHSGRNRIVRRMFEHFGYEVVNLDRVLLGEFDHLKLGRGKWRFLREKEQFYVERIRRSKAPRRKK
jgi:23S rRNA pseudouridine2605 synthase